MVYKHVVKGEVIGSRWCGICDGRVGGWVVLWDGGLGSGRVEKVMGDEANDVIDKQRQ